MCTSTTPIDRVTTCYCSIGTGQSTGQTTGQELVKLLVKLLVNDRVRSLQQTNVFVLTSS